MMKATILVAALGFMLFVSGPAFAQAPATSPALVTSTLPPTTIANPPAITPSAGVAWLTGRLGVLTAAAQGVATPAAVVALIAAGFALLIGWLFSANFLRLIGQWVIGGVLFGYFLIMAAPRLVAAAQGFIAR